MRLAAGFGVGAGETVSYKSNKPINVSSVPQRSPFRYPGGKTWLVPYIRDWLGSKRTQPSRLIEPFAGGAIVSLTAAFEGLADMSFLQKWMTAWLRSGAWF